MGRGLTFAMTIAVLGGFAIILLLNVASLVGVVPSRFISPNDVRGMAVEHHGLLYTLNFNQQNALIEILNRAIPVTQAEVEARKISNDTPIGVKKIIIYQFNAPDIEITSVAYVAKSSSIIGQKNIRTNMVFSAPTSWNPPHGLLEESAADELQKLLLTTFDP